jgi:hypothetical protein
LLSEAESEELRIPPTAHAGLTSSRRRQNKIWQI